MYLKRLESVGFKSFAERIQVDFVPGVTAVVGPNGSGKSNITDAIRWVLGEQSAKSLRGSKMEDIIFQGSDSRRALNVAEVSLVLDNNDHAVPLDYEEISITRRVYRSGDSEFYINKQSCRLKDIVDLFMDSGLGREAFSIISQGKVEEILSSKAEERRTIFEEAAGVLKYKQRKKKAEYKLAETQENLNRVEDIVHEIEQQLGPLQEQAEKAKRYNQAMEELKQQEISLMVTEIEQLHSQWQQLLEKSEKEKENELAMKTDIQKKEANLEEERSKINSLDDEIEQVQTSLLETTQKLEQFEGRKHVLQERMKHYEENRSNLETDKNEAQGRIQDLTSTLQQEKEQLATLIRERDAVKTKVADLKKQLTLDKESIADEIEELKTEYIEYLNNRAANRNEQQSIEQQINQLLVKKHRQEDKNKDVVQARENLENKKEAVEETLSHLERQFQTNEKEAEKIKAALGDEKKVYDELQIKLNQAYQYIEKMKSRKEMLEEMKEDFQGFFHGVKAVLKAREENKLSHIHGAVIELINVPKKYVTAIETVLGGQAQHIVVDEDYVAREAINWLKKTNNGRATFLPLKSIQSRFMSESLLAKVKDHSGFIGIASKLIKCEAVHQKAVEHLMGHVIIATSLKAANEIASLVMRKYRVVTLDGDVVNPGGSMSGGAAKKTNQSLFTRDQELQEITEKLTDFQQKTVQFEKKVQNSRESIVQKEQGLEQKQAELVDSRQSLQETKTKFSQIDMKLSSVSNNLTLYDQDKLQFEAEESELSKRQKFLSQELNQIENKISIIAQKIDELGEQEKMLKENNEQTQHDFHQNQILLAELEERVKNQRGKTKALTEDINEQNQQFEEYRDKLQELIDLKENEVTETQISADIGEYQTNKDNLTSIIQEKRTARSNLTQFVQDAERELKELNKSHQVLTSHLQDLEVKSNRLDVELENRLTRLQTEYTLTYERAKETYPKTSNLDKTKSHVKQIKRSIEDLGTINLGAIDEYDRIMERYTFLSDQKDDLVHAKETMFTVIAEMDEEMQKRFSSTFTKIKDEFAIVFEKLFGGGHAELKLTDPNDMLETGVEIIAQPPGKKLQHLGLLSGGERALTAIALLFAILRVRPVPFCVLDEVEAALDEANVTRFAQYVKMYSEDTQFIVITHRKGTMEEADVLYGVTMQESGVSRLVSVRLEDTKELVQF
ncbi:chromosome segregation protein SMC [Virgibacillus phasianinus]|uniref:Chromosome partition protein Smc n=1 Tax=Virgibacillus phasianinus TaxID=2017483 RepID=A0A220U5W5_9BACI|nr:chromosome segregation protein SMC [Virgibacillus phasianinus]ASK63517.1 chromosome segregation protein SMC [Virgibacillus phasianinus]